MGTPQGAASLDRVRAAGVASVRVGQLEMHLGPPVPPLPSTTHDTDPDAPPPTQRDGTPSADDDERHALEELFHSSGADAAAFYEASRRARARMAQRSGEPQ